MIVWWLYVVVLAASTAIAASVSIWLWGRDRTLMVRLFLAIALLEAIGGVLVVGELLAQGRRISFGLYGVHSAILGAVTPLFFLFVLAYLGYQRHLTRRVIGLVVGVFAVIGLLQATNPIHRLVWSEYAIVESPFSQVLGTPTGLSFMLLLPQLLFYYTGMGLLGANFLFGSGARRKQTAALFVGFLPPFVVTTLWSAGVLPGSLNGAFVIGSTWTLALVAWAVFKHQLFDIVPMARETVFEALEEAVVVVNTDRLILDYNHSAARAFPAIPDAEGKPIESVLPAIRSEESEQSPFAESFDRYDTDERREYSVTVTRLTVGDTLGGYALIIRDVTEREKHVRDLERQATQLERFASTMSHDLRNPMNVASGHIELAKEADGTEHLERAEDALARMSQIIEDTLQLTRQGQTVEEMEQVELAGIARSAWETTETAGATLEIAHDGDVTVYADRSRLRTVFENLFRNAVEHNSPNSRQSTRGNSDDHGSKRWGETADAATDDVTTSPATTDSDSESAEPLMRGEPQDGELGAVTVEIGRVADGFYVEDDGDGIPADERDRIFEYGYTTEADGTGLGLAIVDAIANAHGWSVRIDEGHDGGARIVFEDVDVLEATAHAD